MRKISIVTMIISLSIFILLTAFTSEADEVPGLAKRDLSKLKLKPYVANQLLVCYKHKASAAVTRGIKATPFVEKVTSLGKPVESLAFKEVELKNASSIGSVIKDLKKLPDVVAVSRNYLRKIHYSPADALYATTNWPITVTNIDDAWNTAETGGWLNTAVNVAVLDTGIDTDHEDLVNKLWVNAGETPGNGLDDDGNGYKDDVNGVNFTALSNYPDLYEEWYARYYSAVYALGSDYPEDYVDSIAQKITGNGTTISKVSLLLIRYGWPTKGITVSIRATLSGPDLATATVTKEDLPDSEEEYDISGCFVDANLSSSVTLNNGTTYYVVATTENKDYENTWYLSGMRNYDTYAGGDVLIKQESSWLPLYNSDLMFYTDSYNTNLQDELRDGGHGSHVAGIIAAQHNAVGIAGVSRGAKIMPIRVLDKNGVGGDAGIIAGITYAADNEAKVINMSLGGYNKSDTLQAAINYAHDNDVVVVASAGNDGAYEDEDAEFDEEWAEEYYTSYPAACSNVVSVAATTANDNVRAGFSTWNRNVDVGAPGQHITSAINTGGYDTFSGTSMSAPHVSGLAALLYAQNPAWSADRIVNRITATATDLGSDWHDKYYGYGLIDAGAATDNTTESSSFSISVRSPIINFGSMPSLTATLKGGGWPPSTAISSQQVKIWYPNPNPRTVRTQPYAVLKTLTTNSSGAVSSALPMLFENTAFRLTWVGNSSYQKAFKQFTIRVRPIISIKPSSTRVRRNRIVKLTGAVYPPDDEINYVYIQRSSNGTTWSTLKRLRLSGISYRLRFRVRNSYYYRAITETHSCHYQGTSRRVRVRVY